MYGIYLSDSKTGMNVYGITLNLKCGNWWTSILVLTNRINIILKSSLYLNDDFSDSVNIFISCKKYRASALWGFCPMGLLPYGAFVLKGFCPTTDYKTDKKNTGVILACAICAMEYTVSIRRTKN